MSKAKNNIETEVRDITPEWAGEILDRHYKRVAEGKFAQRPVTKGVVTRYASDMTTGDWQLTHQGIAFDLDDNLIDGQHRLEAVRKSGKTVTMMVSMGWPVGSKPGAQNGKANIIDVIDGGKARSIENMLHIHGQAYAKNYTTAMRFIARIAHNGITPLVTFSSITWMLDELELKASVAKIMSQSNHISDFQGRLVGPLAFYYTAHPKKALEFSNALFNYSGGKGSPVTAYLNWDKTHRRLHTEYKLRALSACIRAHHEGRELTAVHLNREALEWLSGTNPKLRDQIRARIPRNR